MIGNIMSSVTDKALDYIFPLGGGGAASVIGYVTLGSLIEVFVYATIGATVGWGIKLGLDYIFKPLIKKLKK